MSNSVSQKNRNTALWKYFDSLPGTDKCAVCKLCGKKLSYYTTITNLKSHLMRQHSSEYIDLHDECGDSNGEEGEHQDFSISQSKEESVLPDESSSDSWDQTTKRRRGQRKRKSTSAVWNYFDRRSGHRAACKFCSGVLSYKSTITNLKSHLRLLHSAEYMTFLIETGWVVTNEDEVQQIKASDPEIDNAYSDTNTDDRPIDKRKKPIWNYFKRLPDRIGLCKLCNNKISHKTTVTNLKSHLRRQHPSAFSDFLSRKDDTEFVGVGQVDQLDTTRDKTLQSQRHDLRDSKQKNNKFKSDFIDSQALPIKKLKVSEAFLTRQMDTKEKNKLDECLLGLFYKDFQSFRIVEDPGFLKFVSTLNPSYELPHRKIISSRMIPALYKECLTDSMKAVREQAKNVCLTTDCWSTRTREALMSVTAHFLTDNFELRSVMLHCMKYNKSSKTLALSTELKKIAEDWNITDKVTLALSNNTSNITDAISSLGWKHYVCFAYNLNSVVNNSLALFEDTISKVNKIVAYFRKSSIAMDLLIKYQSESQDITEPKVLVKSVPTRWNSILFMFERFSSLKEALTETIPNLNVDLPKITSKEWTNIRELCTVLQPFEKVTCEMNTVQYMAASMAIVVTNGLISVCDKMLNSNFDDVIKNVIIKLKTELSTRFKDIEHNRVLALCTLLDPRFKKHAFTDSSALHEITCFVLQIIEDSIKSEDVNNKPETSSLAEVKEENIKPEVFSIWEKFDAFKTEKPTNAPRMASEELEMYFKDALLARTECPFDWWKSKKLVYPHLCDIVIKRCHIVATSVPCQEMFSKAGYMISDRKTRVTSSKVGQLVFLKANME